MSRTGFTASLCSAALALCCAAACSPSIEAGPEGNGGSGGSVVVDLDATAAIPPWDPSPDANCGGQLTDLKRRPPNILLVLDRSASMSNPDKGNIWSFVVPAVTSIIESTENELRWGLELFPHGDGGECTADTMPTVAQISPGVGLGSYAAIAAQIPAIATGNGTPTDTAILTGMSYLEHVPNDYPRYMLLATDGVPSCVGTASGSAVGGKKPGVTAAVDAIAAARQAGVPTFVVGINSPSSSSSLNDLTAMADAGGQALPHAVCPPEASASSCSSEEYRGFYLATDETALANALRRIIGTVNNCQIELALPPPVPSYVAVKVTAANGQSSQIFQKGSGNENADGAWYYTDDSKNNVIQLEGPACTTISAGAGGTFEIWYGCTSVPVF